MMSRVTSRLKPSPRQSAQDAAQKRMATQGARDFELLFCEKFWQHAVTRHREREARVAHHQGVEHAERTHHPTKYDQEPEPLESQEFAADETRHSRPRAV